MYTIPQLPNKLFLVRVPILATYSPEEIEVLGLPTTYNSFGNYDNQAYRNFTTCMLPLTKIIDIYISNFPIYIVNKEDTAIMHKMLLDYLQDLYYNNVDYNIKYTVDDRVDDIEKFAREMFNINLRYEQPKVNNVFNDTVTSLPRLEEVPIVDEVAELAKKTERAKPITTEPDITYRHEQSYTLEQPVYGQPIHTQPTYYVPVNNVVNVNVSAAYDNLPVIDPTK